jgi:hypothetical protein
MNSKPKVDVDLNDDLSDLLGGDYIPTTPRVLPTDPGLVRVRETVEEFVEQCPKCRGTGRFVSYSGRDCGECFTCKGRGNHTFKTSPEHRAQARQKAADRPAKNWEAFTKNNPEAAAHVLKGMERVPFLRSMKEAVEKYGDLTEKQLAAVMNGVARDKEYAAKKATQVQAAPTVDASKILEAFQKGREAGLEDLKLRFEGLTVKPAQFDPTGNTLLVKAGQTNIGKIEGGRFIAFRACTPELLAKVVEVFADPGAAAQAYGFATSSCCVCGRKLTNEESVNTGIGPICSGRMGWTPGRKKVSAPEF